MGANAHCPTGKTMLGGGFTRDGVDNDDDFEMVTSYPTVQSNAWQVFAKYEGGRGDHWTIKAWAVCGIVR